MTRRSNRCAGTELGNLARLEIGKYQSGPIVEVEQVIQLLRRAVEREGNQGAFARRVGVSRSYINQALNGNKPIPDSVLKVLKLRRVFTSE
jgi:transcriptional regulator with XRE-family HTH domain